MKHFLPLFGFLALFGALAPVAEARTPYVRLENSAYYGVHPYDVRTDIDKARRYFQDDMSALTKDYFYYHPDYAKNHALHPVTRTRYYTPRPRTNAYLARYSRRANESHFHLDYAYRPRVRHPECYNYSYARPNRLVAPFGHQCR